MLFLILADSSVIAETMPTYTSSTTVNGKEYCYNYYYQSADDLTQITKLGMSSVNSSCVTTVLLSTYQLVGIQFTLRLYAKDTTYSLVGQVSSTQFRDLAINVEANNSANESFKEFKFALAIHGQMLTIRDSSIKFSTSGLLLAATEPGLVSFLMNQTTLVNYGNLSMLMTYVEGGFFDTVICSFASQNGDQKEYLANFEIYAESGSNEYRAYSCSIGQKFDSETNECIGEVIDGMDCKECALGYMKGRVIKNNSNEVDETHGCYEKAGSLNPNDYDCYYSYAGGYNLQTNCKQYTS